MAGGQDENLHLLNDGSSVDFCPRLSLLFLGNAIVIYAN